MRMLTFMVLVAASLCAGCAPMCTLLGCESGIIVLFTGPDGEPVMDAMGSVTVDGTEIEFDCTLDDDDTIARCSEGYVTLFIDEGETAQFTVTADDGALEMSGELTLDFEDVYPNGEECGVGCQTSHHEVTLEDSPLDG